MCVLLITGIWNSNTGAADGVLASASLVVCLCVCLCMKCVNSSSLSAVNLCVCGGGCPYPNSMSNVSQCSLKGLLLSVVGELG